MRITSSNRLLQDLVRQIRDREIDLQPDFQRGEIWDRKRQQRLIDTIVREWYIPAVHIVTTKDGIQQVLDGQQRLATIRSFFDNEFAIDGKIEPSDPRIADLDGLKFSQLTPQQQRRIDNFSIQTIILDEYKPEEPNELFFRLNQSYNLTPPEKRNALHGAARTQIRQIVNELVDTGLLSKNSIGFSNGRLAYDDIIARTCVTIEKNSLRTHINNNVVEAFYRDREFDPHTIIGVVGAGNLLHELISKSSTKIRFNKGTLQSWMIFCYWCQETNTTIDQSILERFEQDRISHRRGQLVQSTPQSLALATIVSLYDDRASYRVTDVSSVLIRDLSIHLYAESRRLAPRDDLLSDLFLRIQKDSTQAPSKIDKFLTQSDWGSVLVKEVPGEIREG